MQDEAVNGIPEGERCASELEIAAAAKWVRETAARNSGELAGIHFESPEFSLNSPII